MVYSQDFHTFTGRVRNFANMHKPHIDIQINTPSSSAAASQRSTFVHSFSTRDKIEGFVYITAPNDTPFDNIEISFVGSIKTYVDKVGTVSAVNNRLEAFHQFLKLTQPINEALFPEDRIAKAGRTYKFPFTFVIPDELLPSACRHKTNNTKIKDAHLQLPPSLGDPDLAGTGTTLLDDMSPDMARVSYAVKARMIRSRLRDGKESIVSDRSKKVRVIPATFEQPPVDVDGMEEEYELRKEKSIKKGMFKSKLGRIAVEAAQPKSLRLAPTNNVDAGTPTTMASVMIRFDPAEADTPPPRLGGLSSKLRVTTFFASCPLRDYVSKATVVYDPSQGIHIETIPLSSRCVMNAQWERHAPGTSPSDAMYRRDSAVSISSLGSSCPEPTKAYSSDKPFYTAQILVPITLPTNKSFVPTFNSCLVSRVYTIEFSLSIPNQSGSAGVPTNIALKVPVQVSSSSNQDSNDGLAISPEEQAAMEQQHVDEYFMPRSIAPPPAHYLETGRIGSEAAQGGRTNASSAPPDYSYFAPTSGVVPVCG